jgi:hypothetical protein
MLPVLETLDKYEKRVTFLGHLTRVSGPVPNAHHFAFAGIGRVFGMGQDRGEIRRELGEKARRNLNGSFGAHAYHLN